MARPERFELPTYGFVDHRSIQLSYGRAVVAADNLKPRQYSTRSYPSVGAKTSRSCVGMSRSEHTRVQRQRVLNLRVTTRRHTPERFRSPKSNRTRTPQDPHCRNSIV